MSKRYIIPVEIEELEEGGYLAVCEVIQGCHAEGDTVPEALENLEDVARVLLELRLEDGLDLPDGLTEAPPGEVELRAQLVVPLG